MLPHAIRSGLERNRHSRSILSIQSADFRVGQLRWGRSRRGRHKRAAVGAKASGQCVETFVSDEWTLEYDLAYSGLAEHVYVAAQLAKKDEALDEATRRTETAAAEAAFSTLEDEARKAAEENNADGCSYGEILAAKVYAQFTKGTRASKAVAAQYLAGRLQSEQAGGDLTTENLRARLPQYLVHAIEYVTPTVAQSTVSVGQVRTDE